MVQKLLPFKGYRLEAQEVPETAKAVGLRCEDQVVTLRFMEDGTRWGESARQIKLDRRLAEQLSRLLADELEDYA